MACSSKLLRSYASFSGRTTRGSFWPLFMLALIVLIPLLIAVPPIGVLLAAFIILPLAGAATRRMHDVGLSGRWLLPLIVIPTLMLIILVLANSMLTLILVAAIDAAVSDGDISRAAVSAETVLAWTFGISFVASLAALAWRGAGPNRFGNVAGGIDPDGRSLPDRSERDVDFNWQRRPEQVRRDRSQ
jgi:uncharacterized membrane protein YhaH (DUF805 family)